MDGVVGPFDGLSISLNQSRVIDGLAERSVGCDEGKGFLLWYQFLLEWRSVLYLLLVDSLQWLFGELLH